MTLGFNGKEVRGFLWPEEDTDCMAVTFDWLPDLDEAIGLCRHHRVAVQAGGNTGVWPRRLGEAFKAVYTFEPEPRNFYCLAHNCPESHIFKFQAALGDDHKLVGIDYPEGQRNLGACCLNGAGSIPVLQIDDLYLNQCDLIQLDVEGYDFKAIKGAVQTIRAHHPVIMVEDKGLSEKYGVGKGHVEWFLTSLGYKVVARPHRDVILVYDGGKYA